MLTSKKKKQANQQKDAKVEAQFATMEKQIQAIREDTDRLQKLLADHPDDRVRMLLNSISSNLQGDLSKTIDDAQALHEMTAQAKESLNELNKAKSAYGEKIVSDEIQKVAAELRLMSGNDVDTLVLIILNGFRGLGWAQIQISAGDYIYFPSGWSFRDGEGINTEHCLSLSAKQFPFMKTTEGRQNLCRKLSELGLKTDTSGYEGNIVVYKM